MEKIIKRFFIIFSLSFFFVSKCYALDYNVFYSAPYTGNLSVSFSSNESSTELFSKKIYTDNFTWNKISSTGLLNSVLYYDTQEEVYYYIMFFSNPSNSNVPKNGTSVKITCDSGSCNPLFLSTSNAWTGGWGMSMNMIILSKDNVSALYKKIYDNNSMTPEVVSSSDNKYYLTYALATSQSRIPQVFRKFIVPNKDRLQLLYIQTGEYYLQDEKQEVYTPEPTPEPEPEPEPEPTVNLDKIYVPNYIQGQCVEILDKDTIRVFEDENSYTYIDYYINSHYISKSGQTEPSYIRNCSDLEFTNLRYYGNDFPEILIIVISISIFSVGFPYILYKRFRKR